MYVRFPPVSTHPLQPCSRRNSRIVVAVHFSRIVGVEVELVTSRDPDRVIFCKPSARFLQAGTRSLTLYSNSHPTSGQYVPAAVACEFELTDVVCDSVRNSGLAAARHVPGRCDRDLREPRAAPASRPGCVRHRDVRRQGAVLPDEEQRHGARCVRPGGAVAPLRLNGRRPRCVPHCHASAPLIPIPSSSLSHRGLVCARRSSAVLRQLSVRDRLRACTVLSRSSGLQLTHALL